MAKHTPRPATRAIADATSKPPFRYEPGPDGARQSRSRADGFYLCRSPNYATASVAVQSRWGNLYATPAAVRSLAVDVDRRAQVIAEVATPADGPVADRLPGQEARAGRPPNVVKQAARMVRLLVDATAAAAGPLPGQDIPSVTSRPAKVTT